MHDMKTKEGFARLTVWIPKEQYNQLLQRKMINGVPMSQSISEVLDIRTEGVKSRT